MSYKYITENNLENAQNYMYSEYGGETFLQEYAKTRIKNSRVLGENSVDDEIKKFILLESQSGNFQVLVQEYKEILENKKIKNPQVIEFFIKVFELRKKIYIEYQPESYRPVEESGYTELETYIILGLILVELYSQKGNLKYLNTLLKLNDTLLSIINKFDEEKKLLIEYLVMKEYEFVKSLCNINTEIEIG